MVEPLPPDENFKTSRTFPVALRMPTKLFQQIYGLALAEGYSTEKQILIALEEWLAAREKQPDQI